VSESEISSPACIANNGANGEPEVPLWECPCAECVALDRTAAFDPYADDDDGEAEAREGEYTAWEML
jgi:hypothetical protein